MKYFKVGEKLFITDCFNLTCRANIGREVILIKFLEAGEKVKEGDTIYHSSWSGWMVSATNGEPLLAALSTGDTYPMKKVLIYEEHLRRTPPDIDSRPKIQIC